MIPSRGALLLTAPGEAAAALDTALQQRRLQRRHSLDRRRQVSRSRPKAPTTRSWQPAATSSRVSPASYSETWTITGVTDGGELHGTIEISTVTRHGT